jgi:hypothetical protein
MRNYNYKSTKSSIFKTPPHKPLSTILLAHYHRFFSLDSIVTCVVFTGSNFGVHRFFFVGDGPWISGINGVVYLSSTFFKISVSKFLQKFSRKVCQINHEK